MQKIIISIYLLVIIFVCLSNQQFIKIHKLVKLYELTTYDTFDDLNNLKFNQKDSYNYVVGDECVNKSSMLSNSNDTAIRLGLNTSLLMYQGYRYNIHIMHELVIRLPQNTENSTGFELKFSVHDSKEKICISVKHAKNKSLKANSYFKLIIKDPEIYELKTNESVIYLGSVTVGLLTNCGQELCVLNNTITNSVNTGLKNANPAFDTVNYSQTSDQECYTETIYKLCIHTISIDNRVFAILLQSVPDYVNEIESTIEEVGNLNKTKISFIKNDKNVLKYGSLTWKIVELKPKKYYNIQSFFRNQSHHNDCVSDKNSAESLPITRLIYTNDRNSYNCKKSPFDSIPIKDLKFISKFQGREIDSLKLDIPTIPIHLDKYFPQICLYEMKKTENRKQRSFRLSFNDRSLVSRTSAFDIKYKIRKYLLCIPDDKQQHLALKKLNYINGTLKTDEESLIVEPNGVDILIDSLAFGHIYAFEITPVVKSNECGSLCPYFEDKMSFSYIKSYKCEECKKMFFYFYNKEKLKYEDEDKICLQSVYKSKLDRVDYTSDNLFITLNNFTIDYPIEPLVLYNENHHLCSNEEKTLNFKEPFIQMKHKILILSSVCSVILLVILLSYIERKRPLRPILREINVLFFISPNDVVDKDIQREKMDYFKNSFQTSFRQIINIQILNDDDESYYNVISNIGSFSKIIQFTNSPIENQPAFGIGKTAYDDFSQVLTFSQDKLIIAAFKRNNNEKNDHVYELPERSKELISLLLTEARDFVSSDENRISIFNSLKMFYVNRCVSLKCWLLTRKLNNRFNRV